MQELEATEKPNIFETESITIEHRKTVTNYQSQKLLNNQRK